MKHIIKHILWLSTAAVLAGVQFASADGPTVLWDPLGPVRREADTLLLPDLTSAATVEKDGGFALGAWEERKPAAEVYEFGPGRHGPAFRGRKGAYSFMNWACDGLVPGDEFTIEFSFRADRPWADMWSGRGFFQLRAGNTLDVYNEKQSLVVRAANDNRPGQRHLSLALEPWSLDDQKWHVLGLTLTGPNNTGTGSDPINAARGKIVGREAPVPVLSGPAKDGVLVVWLDGKKAGELRDLPWGPLWSDTTHADGILLGGTPGISKGWFWISDFRISRTARVPGTRVPMRPIEGKLVVDANKAVGALPPHLLGALHPTTTAGPGVLRQGLHVIRTDKVLVATPIKRGGADAEHPSKGRSGLFSYDWQVCDRTFDWMKDQGVLPYVSIDATPQILGGSVPPFKGTALKTAMSFESGFGPNPPDNLDDWAAIVGDFVHHVLKERGDVVPWWGVWNEPAGHSSFWKQGLAEYLDLYAATVKAVRRVDPRARVGGPETAGPWDRDDKGGFWLQGLIQRCARQNLPLDFISYHDYDGSLLTPELVKAKVAEWSKAAGLAQTPTLLIGEYNWAAENYYKLGKPHFNQGVWHLRSLNAAYTTAFLTRLADLGGFELLTFSHTGYGSPRNGGWSSCQLIGPKGERWAPFNALAGWKTVTGRELLAAQKQDLPPGVFALASRDPATQRIGLVLANYGFAQRQARRVQVTVRALAGPQKLTRWLVDTAHSSRWDLAEDRPEGAAQDGLAQVEQRPLAVTNGEAVVDLELPPNSATFITMARGEAR
jgi:hypothetical protein